MILVDTSVWVDHFRRSDRLLIGALDQGVAGVHPFVIGELALGHLRQRAAILGLLNALPQSEPATHDEVLLFAHEQKLAGTGVGWIDAHLLAAARLSGWSLWTSDRRLKTVAERLGIVYDARKSRIDPEA